MYVGGVSGFIIRPHLTIVAVIDVNSEVHLKIYGNKNLLRLGMPLFQYDRPSHQVISPERLKVTWYLCVPSRYQWPGFYESCPWAFAADHFSTALLLTPSQNWYIRVSEKGLIEFDFLEGLEVWFCRSASWDATTVHWRTRHAVVVRRDNAWRSISV